MFHSVILAIIWFSYLRVSILPSLLRTRCAHCRTWEWKGSTHDWSEHYNVQSLSSLYIHSHRSETFCWKWTLILRVILRMENIITYRTRTISPSQIDETSGVQRLFVSNGTRTISVQLKITKKYDRVDVWSFTGTSRLYLLAWNSFPPSLSFARSTNFMKHKAQSAAVANQSNPLFSFMLLLFWLSVLSICVILHKH